MTDPSEMVEPTGRADLIPTRCAPLWTLLSGLFGADVGYGQIVKFYDAEPIGPGR
jgi:hypothetical protein